MVTVFCTPNQISSSTSHFKENTQIFFIITSLLPLLPQDLWCKEEEKKNAKRTYSEKVFSENILCIYKSFLLEHIS